MKKIIVFVILLHIFSNSFSQGIIESNNRFSFDFYQKIKSNNENIIFSPASITSAFAMTYIGAKNNTLKEISEVFYFNKNILDFSADYKNLLENISNSKTISLSNANSLWIQEKMNLNSEFLANNQRNFTSSLYFTDFIGKPENSRLYINSWVEKNTNGKITDLLKPSIIDNSTRLILVNALYFKGSWNKAFNKEQNSKAPFQISKRNCIKTEFMNNALNAWIYEGSFYRIIEIPYSGEEISLVIFLPRTYNKLKKLEDNFNFEMYSSYLINREKKRVELSIPKFNIESEYSLTDALNKLGLKESFTESADFSGISESEKLFINKVVHKATIEVNEEGTEAAAATAIIMSKTAILIDSAPFVLDKPFIYLIRNNNTNCIYFMGKIVNPNL